MKLRYAFALPRVLTTSIIVIGLCTSRRMRYENVAVRRRLFGFDEACPVHSRFKYACFGRYEMGHVYAWRWIVGCVEFYWVRMIRELGAAEILASGEMRCVSEVGKREKEHRAILEILCFAVPCVRPIE